MTFCLSLIERFEATSSETRERIESAIFVSAESDALQALIHALAIFGADTTTAEFLVLDTAFFDVVIWDFPFL
jgi:P2-related tail formation protein